MTTDTPLSNLAKPVFSDEHNTESQRPQLVESTGTDEIVREGNVRTNLKRTEGIENLGTEEIELVSEEDNEEILDDNNIHNLEEREEQPLIEVTTKYKNRNLFLHV